MFKKIAGFFVVLTFTVAFIFVVGFAVQGTNFIFYKWYASQTEIIRRNVMLESRSYNEATNRRLYELKLQYTISQNQNEKNAIAAIIKHEIGAINRSNLPVDLHQFVETIH